MVFLDGEFPSATGAAQRQREGAPTDPRISFFRSLFRHCRAPPSPFPTPPRRGRRTRPHLLHIFVLFAAAAVAFAVAVALTGRDGSVGTTQGPYVSRGATLSHRKLPSPRIYPLLMQVNAGAITHPPPSVWSGLHDRRDSIRYGAYF